MIDTPEQPLPDSGSSPRALGAPVLVAFFISGIAGLVHQVVWTRLLRHVMGNTTFAISTVLTVFMAGLALGAWLGGRWIERRRDPLRVFGAVEAAIGAFAFLIVPALISGAQPIYRALYAMADGNLPLVTAARFLVSAAILLIPATLMGSTLPILTRLIALGGGQLAGSVGKLYAVNTLGAALGAAGTGFVLLPGLGMQLTLFTGSALNFVAAFTGFALHRAWSKRPAPEAAVPLESAPASPDGHLPVRLLLVLYGLSGFAALVYEVSWTRVLSAQIGSTVYAFTMMLTAFILGLGLGSLVAARWVEGLRRPVLTLGLLQLGVALGGLALIPLFGWLPPLLTTWIAGASDSFALLQATEFVVLVGLMLVPTSLMGAMFPLVGRLVLRGPEGAARRVGAVYSANTVGTILGSFGCGFLLIPMIGTQDAMALGVALNALVAILVLLRAKGQPLLRNGFAALSLVAGTLVFWVPDWNPSAMTFGPFMEARRNAESSSDSGLLREMIAMETERGGVLFHEEGLNTTVTVRRDPLGQISLWVNGKPDASTGTDLATQQLLAHVPLLLHPEPKRALVVGLASGITLGSAATHPLERLECAEISGAVVRASDFFRDHNGRVLEDPRVELIVEDGRNHLAMTDATYDVIISEPSNPWIAGVADLFTVEYFELLHDRLNEDGVACVWLAHYNLDAGSFKSVVRSFLDVFPGATMWNPQEADYLLVGTRETVPRVDVNRFLRAAGRPAVTQDLARCGVRNAADLLGRQLCGPLELAAFSERALLHTDDRAQLEFAAPRNMARNADEGALFRAIEAVRAPRFEYLTGKPEARTRELQGRATQVVVSNGLALEGQLLLSEKRFVEGLAAGKRAHEASPGNPKLRSFLDYGHEVGQGLCRVGDLAQGMPLLEGLLEIDEARPDSQLVLGRALDEAGYPGRATMHYDAAVRHAPNLVEARDRLAWNLAVASGPLYNPQLSLEHAEKAVQLTQRANPYSLRTLAAALGGVGRFDEALQTVSEARALLDVPELRAELEPLLAEMERLFRMGQPWRLQPRGER